MNNREIIERYKNLKSINNICKENNINFGNLSKNRTTEKNELIIAQKCIEEISKIVNDYLGVKDETNTL